GYSLRTANDELEKARKNRKAAIGLFIFAKPKAPEGLASFQRLGDDLFIVWDDEDQLSDIYLQAGLMVARALCARLAKQRDACVDFDGIQKAIMDIEKKAEDLDEIRKAAMTINRGANKILKRVKLARKGISDQLKTLNELISDWRQTLQEGAVA